MRLFVALDIDEAIRIRIVRFMDRVREFAPETRWVGPEAFHVTLKFIGEKTESDFAGIKEALENIQSEAFELNFRGHGFFPTPRAPRVFWIGIEASANLISLATAVDTRLEALDIPKDEHQYSPHLTLARSSGASGSPRPQKRDGTNSRFQRLQEKLKGLPTPEFGTMTAREFFLYQSKLSPSGSNYTKLAALGLR
jgi:2'-5' RNA ligase